jgi:hypothetical protein
VNSASYCEVLLKLQDAIHGNVKDNWHDGYCSILTMPDLIEPDQPRWEFKNDNGNFLDIYLPYSPDLAPSDLDLFGPLKATLVANIPWQQRGWNRAALSAWDNNQKTFKLRVSMHS